ncbi:hypothetical protein OF83DRAFT_1179645, partial [Amylostereum chailletii]
MFMALNVSSSSSLPFDIDSALPHNIKNIIMPPRVPDLSFDDDIDMDHAPPVAPPLAVPTRRPVDLAFDLDATPPPFAPPYASPDSTAVDLTLPPLTPSPPLSPGSDMSLPPGSPIEAVGESDEDGEANEEDGEADEDEDDEDGEDGDGAKAAVTTQDKGKGRAVEVASGDAALADREGGITAPTST